MSFINFTYKGQDTTPMRNGILHALDVLESLKMQENNNDGHFSSIHYLGENQSRTIEYNDDKISQNRFIETDVDPKISKYPKTQENKLSGFKSIQKPKPLQIIPISKYTKPSISPKGNSAKGEIKNIFAKKKNDQKETLQPKFSEKLYNNVKVSMNSISPKHYGQNQPSNTRPIKN